MSPKEGKLNLIAYMRTSRLGDRDARENVSKARQQERIEAYAKLDGHTIIDCVYEADRSGGDDLRPKWQAAMARVEDPNDQADGIIVAKLDRFARSAADGLKAVTRIEKRGGTFISVAERFDTANEYGRFTMTIFFALAELELNRIKRQFNGDVEDAIRRGLHVGPTPPGYTRTIVSHTKKGAPAYGPLKPSEHADAVTAAFEARAKGASWADVARLLTAAGVPTRTAADGTQVVRPWNVRGAMNLCLNDIYLGRVRWGEYTNETAHQPLITRGLWRAVRERDGAPKAASKIGHEGPLLGGLVRCGTCGSRMSRTYTVVSGQRYTYFRCQGNPTCTSRASISERVLEERTVPMLDELLAAQHTSDATSDNDVELRRAERDAAQADLNDFLNAVKAGTMKPVTAAALMDAAQERLDVAEAALDACEAKSTVLHLTTTDERGTAERRAAYQRLGRSIVVAKGRGPDRVTLEKVA